MEPCQGEKNGPQQPALRFISPEPGPRLLGERPASARRVGTALRKTCLRPGRSGHAVTAGLADFCFGCGGASFWNASGGMFNTVDHTEPAVGGAPVAAVGRVSGQRRRERVEEYLAMRRTRHSLAIRETAAAAAGKKRLPPPHLVVVGCPGQPADRRDSLHPRRMGDRPLQKRTRKPIYISPTSSKGRDATTKSPGGLGGSV